MFRSMFRGYFPCNAHAQTYKCKPTQPTSFLRIRSGSHSILGGLLDGFWLECFWLCEGLALNLPTVSRHVYIRIGRNTYDLRLSPSFLNPSIILNISFLPCVASTLFPPMLILTFSFACAISSFLNSKCLICIQTKTPQSLLFSCCGESARSMK